MSMQPFESQFVEPKTSTTKRLSRRAFIERSVALSLSSGAVASALAACGETTSSSTPSVDANATLKIVGDNNNNWSNAQKYNKEYPNLKINLIASSWGNGGKDMKEKELVMMSGGDFPDIAQMVWLKEFARSGLLVDLTNEAKKWDVYKSLSKGQLERMSYNGRIYGLTIGNNTIFQYYNKDILARAGVTGPIQSLDDLYALSKKLASLKTKDGKTIYTTSFDGGNWATDYWLWAGGGQQMNEDYSKTLIDSPESVKAYTFMQNLVKSGSAPKPDGSATQLWLNGQIAVYFSGGWDAQASSEAKLNYGSSVTPKGPGGLNTTSIGGVEYAIFKNSKHRTEALSLLKTMASDSFQKSKDAISAIINLSAYEDPTKQATWKGQGAGVLESALVTREQLNSSRYNFLEAPFVFADASTIYNDALQQILVKLSDPAKVMKDAATQINQGISDAAK
ncbi:ABC transporter substrate-binding protein [Dictyobacter alpinus]|uniref:ABC transporter substrate-binding protein n=1 Tax=Dictyobacter alpinus TaxID=2014873 RepID=A0A402B1D8_9CHLR|nr:sugar ABC transporter substrate-binding protein [Dictyobacter alpinus]GCE25180.1 ABC transporter substrate-binding protein [Dictyobacter alpinus]